MGDELYRTIEEGMETILSKMVAAISALASVAGRFTLPVFWQGDSAGFVRNI